MLSSSSTTQVTSKLWDTSKDSITTHEWGRDIIKHTRGVPPCTGNQSPRVMCRGVVGQLSLPRTYQTVRARSDEIHTIKKQYCWALSWCAFQWTLHLHTAVPVATSKAAAHVGCQPFFLVTAIALASLFQSASLLLPMPQPLHKTCLSACNTFWAVAKEHHSSAEKGGNCCKRLQLAQLQPRHLCCLVPACSAHGFAGKSSRPPHLLVRQTSLQAMFSYKCALRACS